MKFSLLTVLALLMLASFVLAVPDPMQQGSDGIMPDESSSSLLGPSERLPTVVLLPEVLLHEESSGCSFLRKLHLWRRKRSEQAMLTSRQQAVYAVDKKSKIWFFNARENHDGGVHFVLSGKLDDVNQQIVKDVLQGRGELSDSSQHFHGA